MTPIPDLRITLELGARRRVLLGGDVAAVLSAQLLGLLLAGRSENARTEGEPTEGEGKVPINEIKTPDSDPSPSSRNIEASQTPLPKLDAATDWLAALLAHALKDERSIRYYHLVAETIPLGRIRGALSLALELDEREVKRSRAAYFTAILRPERARTSPT